jgi:hypothetical protein
MIMSSDHIKMVVELVQHAAIENKMCFAIHEGGHKGAIIGASVVSRLLHLIRNEWNKTIFKWFEKEKKSFSSSLF